MRIFKNLINVNKISNYKADFYYWQIISFFFDTFSDIDECADGTAKCTDICVNKFGSYSCECHRGFQLTADDRSCEGEFFKFTYYLKFIVTIKVI